MEALHIYFCKCLTEKQFLRTPLFGITLFSWLWFINRRPIRLILMFSRSRYYTKFQFNGKKALGLQHSYSMSYAAKHSSLSSVVLVQSASKQLFFQLIFTQTLTFLQFGQKTFSSSNTIETDIHCVILWSEYMTSNPVHVTCLSAASGVHSYGLPASERNEKQLPADTC